jgi:aminoglycoside phosphotransferase (APT) family kinase protein
MYMLAGKAGLPTPPILGYHDIEGVPFLVVDKLPGKHWKTYIEESGYSLQAYLQSLEFLGMDIAKAHRISLPSYGDVISATSIHPAGITNFAARLEHIFSLKLKKAEKVLPREDFAVVQNYFDQGVQSLAEHLAGDKYKPVLVLTNLHPMNFLVDKQGKPSGYPDLEFSQAGVKALEMYNMGSQLFSYFDQPTFDAAQEAFFRGYAAQGGVYDVGDKTNQKLEALLCAGHTLSAVTGYHGARDGLRDTWSSEFKDLLFKVMSAGEMDYIAFADIIRQKTKQPRTPTLP